MIDSRLSFLRLFHFGLILFHLLFSRENLANEPTTFKWVVTSDTPPKGHCVEVDSKTMGSVFLKRAPTDRCRPADSLITSLWLQNSDGPGGRCYHVDAQSMGSMYSRSVGQKECEPENTTSHLIEGKCYLKGERNDGGVYLVSVLKERCKPDETIVQFVLAANGLSGKCLSVDSSSGQSFSEPLKKCKPQDIEYISLDLKGEASCFEVAVDGGAARYIQKVNNKFCRPKKTQYIWLQEKEESGTCYLTGAHDTSYKEKADPKYCFKLYDTTLDFRVLSPIRGKCFIVDRKEKGGQLRQFVSTDKCMALSEKLETRLISYQDRPYCIQIDMNDPTYGFRKTVAQKECYDHLGIFVWTLTDAAELKGTCYEKIFVGTDYQYKGVRNKLCRTPETYFKWVVKSKEEVLLGSCYEIDKERGPQGFALKVAKKKCKPKDDLVVRYFHPKEFKKGGCYLVDKKTLGGLYSMRTDVKKCKDKLFSK